MGLMYIYAIFAITTALISTFRHFNRALAAMEFNKVDSPVVDQKLVATVTYFLLCCLAAPLVVIATISPDLSERFYHGIYDSLSKNES